ncbi:MAG: hypothetical protein Q8Q06_01620 [bacterium]|nr:hypothetical protein [bacterium]
MQPAQAQEQEIQERIEDIKMGTLTKNIEEAELKMKNIAEEQAEINKQVRVLNEQQKKLDNEKNDATLKISLFKEALLARREPSKEVMRLRKMIIQKIADSNDENISVKKLGELKGEIDSLKKDFQKICLHPFVFGHSGYEGSYSYDRDDWYYGRRLCIVCGFSEYAVKTPPDEKFVTLFQHEGRLVRSNLNHKDGLPDIWRWSNLREIINKFFVDKRVFKMVDGTYKHPDLSNLGKLFKNK